MPGATTWLNFFLRPLLTLAVLLVLSVSGPAEAAVLADALPEPAAVWDRNDARIPPGVGALSGPQSAVTAPSGDYRIDALLSGYALSGTSATYSFYEDDVFGGEYYGSEPGVGEVSESVKTNVRQVMAWFGSIMNVQFTEVAETATTVGLIRFMVSDAPSYAYAYYPQGTSMFYVGSDVHLNRSYDRLGDGNGFQQPPGRHGYATLVHETGHALGLKHPFEAVGGRTTVLPASEDNYTNTVMSYTFPGRAPATGMVYDIAALQYMYGARSRNSGDDTYAFTGRGTSQHTVGGITYWVTSQQAKQAIWDSGGIDTLDASALPYRSGGYSLDLRGGGWLVAADEHDGNSYEYGSSLALGTGIENILTAGSDDTIYANGLANTFGGYEIDRTVGADRIIGASAADTVYLAGYRSSSVTSARVGDDLVLGLKACGSITIVGYYAGFTPAVVYGANEAPVASIVLSGTRGVAPYSVRADGQSSRDDGIVASYSWDFGDGATGAGSVVEHLYSQPGTYTISLEVTDDEGVTAEAEATVTVAADLQAQTVAGPDRYATAVTASQRAYPDGAGSVVIATGENWPDALGGSALAGALDAPLLLTRAASVPTAVLDEVARLGVTKVYVLGGNGAVSEGAFRELQGAVGPGSVVRLAGSDRYQTAAVIARETITIRQAQPEGYDGTAFVATGANFPDALAAAPIAAAQGWPLFLAHPTGRLDGLPGDAMAGVRWVYVLGGDAAVDRETESSLRAVRGVKRTIRLAGDDRYGTAVRVATFAVDSAGHVWDGVGITTGANFPDALAGGVLQGKAGSVMLLTPPTALSARATAALTSHKDEIVTVTFFGGASAVTQPVRDAVMRALR